MMYLSPQRPKIVGTIPAYCQDGQVVAALPRFSLWCTPDGRMEFSAWLRVRANECLCFYYTLQAKDVNEFWYEYLYDPERVLRERFGWPGFDASAAEGSPSVSVTSGKNADEMGL